MSQVYLIDVPRCTGCQACAIACKDRAHLADDVDWLRVERREGGRYPRPTLEFRVAHCWHCADPACAAACPAEAIARDAQGRMQIDGGLCTSCGACVAACPFGAIALPGDGPATKCDGCADELARGWEPTCVRACPMRALGWVCADAPLPEGRVRDVSFGDGGLGPGVWVLRRG